MSVEKKEVSSSASLGDTSYRSLFESRQTLVGIVVHEKKDVGKVLQLLDGFAYVQKATRHVQDYTFPVPVTLQKTQDVEGDASPPKRAGSSGRGNPTTTNVRCILLDPSLVIAASTVTSATQDPFDLTVLPQELQDSLASGYITKWVTDNKAPSNKTTTTLSPIAHYPSPVSITTKEIVLTYKNYNMAHLIQGVFKDAAVKEQNPSIAELVVPSGFEQVGHIAHLNLQSGQLPYKHQIGQIVIDTNPTVGTVVNKLESLSSEFRELPLEVIAGDGSKLTAEVKQHGCIFRVPYDKVYWNSRLGEEHERLVKTMNRGDTLFDVMAGVGPFAVPAAKRGVISHANDLNPAGESAIAENARINKAQVKAYCLDGRVFIRMVRDQYLRRGAATPSATCVGSGRKHFVMNLPALAVTFCDAFTGPDWEKGDMVDKNFIVHCYTFSSSTVPKADAVEQVYTNLFKDSLGNTTSPAVLANMGKRYVNVENTVIVRDVAPKKLMVCVSFSFHPEVFEPKLGVSKETVATASGDEPDHKRRRFEE